MGRGFSFMPLLVIAGIFLGIVVFGLSFIMSNPTLQLLFRFYMIIVIYFFVERILGRGMATYAVTGVLAYIFVWHLWMLAGGVYITYLIFAFGFSGVIIFGLQSLYR